MEEEEALLLWLLVLEGVVAVEEELELEDPENVKGEQRGEPGLSRHARYIPHSACSSCWADATSAAVQFAWRHAAAAAWKAVLVQTQVRSVLEKKKDRSG